ncbi:unnamed protein product [Cuscuta campestris]|uniref:Cyclin-L1-1 n=1 Tax=Cuscuta campestris TaxID=132261 RepID=A0A484MHG1_9ASTE|nr:unnamed protein product [Cuscuta campestris]
MIYTAIDTFYLTDEQLKNSPSRRDGIDDATETTLQIYGCDFIQESGILLKLPQAVMATGQVLFHRFYCKKSFAHYNVKRVAASCVWLASKLEECPRKARQVLTIFHRLECRRENLPIEHFDTNSKKYVELKADLVRTERHLLKEMGFVCHVEHPHKFISNYIATLGMPDELRQEAWNLANDSLRTTLCVRFKSEVVACGVVYAAARRFQVPLPENPPWWKAFDADKAGIDEVCRVLAHLYSLPKAQYMPVCKEAGSFSTSNRSWDSPSQSVPKEVASNGPSGNDDTSATQKGAPAAAAGQEVGKDVATRAPLEKAKSSEESKSSFPEGEIRDEPGSKSIIVRKTEAGTGEKDKNKDRDRERERKKERSKSWDRDRGRERERDDIEREKDRAKGRSYHSRDKGRQEKSKRHSSGDRDYHSSSYSSREKERRRHH